MSNELTTFDFNAIINGTQHRAAIKVVAIDDQPWFVAADVCRALGMDLTGGTNSALRGLSIDERRAVTRRDCKELFLGVPSPSYTVITESGLYKLVMRSDKPQARPFQDWVTRDVLPAIRKDGAYILGEEKVATGELDQEEMVLRAMTFLQGKVARLADEKAHLEAHNTKLSAANAAAVPFLKTLKRLADTSGSFTVTEAAKLLQVKPHWLFAQDGVTAPPATVTAPAIAVP